MLIQLSAHDFQYLLWIIWLSRIFAVLWKEQMKNDKKMYRINDPKIILRLCTDFEFTVKLFDFKNIFTTKIATQDNWLLESSIVDQIAILLSIILGCCVTLMEVFLQRFDFHENIFVVEWRIILIIERFVIKRAAMFW